MYQAILPSADSLIKCLVIFNMPWTLAKGLLDAALCMLIYKPLSPSSCTAAAEPAWPIRFEPKRPAGLRAGGTFCFFEK